MDASGRALATELLCCAARIRKRDAKEKALEAALDRAAQPHGVGRGHRRRRGGGCGAPTGAARAGRGSGSTCPRPDDKGDGGGTFRTPASGAAERPRRELPRAARARVELPEDPELAPRLDIRCFDSSRVGAAPCSGRGAVDLRPKLPWNPVDYVAPQSELFDDAQARALAEQR